jgi:hypothetical protein
MILAGVETKGKRLDFQQEEKRPQTRWPRGAARPLRTADD